MPAVPSLRATMAAVTDGDVYRRTPVTARHLKTPAVPLTHGMGHMPSTEPQGITCHIFKQRCFPRAHCKQHKIKSTKHESSCSCAV